MKSFGTEIRAAVGSTIVLAVVCCGAYPLLVTGVTRTLFRDKADGSLIKDASGKIVGSALLGQTFTGEKYFHPRPSAAGANGYDAASSSGTNLGPTSQKLNEQIKDRVAAYRTTNGLAADQAVPADAVTASGSGLDPHISPANAGLQAARVAKARNLPVERVRDLMQIHTDQPDLGILGDAGVHVLKLNLALDDLPR
ncbi:K(+)-transporting ATPase subunit C [Luteolibacter arcticus]|uniref:Potassium-transporting ATPase KdpC subunit n=1 Tax=Luteolibacter arcticus TaxID=1581411 RepID=A0ABT3GL29_9BACT|nr:K(+)-transporting ATPase subunit C [Luteolibacter arcticus]MCW1924208.1 K(+)-transporting ATPase subunit C [Luteolibacter arcticus]